MTIQNGKCEVCKVERIITNVEHKSESDIDGVMRCYVIVTLKCRCCGDELQEKVEINGYVTL